MTGRCPFSSTVVLVATSMKDSEERIASCHSEERSDEESGAGFLHGSLDPPPQTPRFTRGDTFQSTLEARPGLG